MRSHLSLPDHAIRLHPRDQFWCKISSPSCEPGFTVSPQAPTKAHATTHIAACPHLPHHSTREPVSPGSSNAGKAARRGIWVLRRADGSKAATRKEGCLSARDLRAMVAWGSSHSRGTQCNKPELGCRTAPSCSTGNPPEGAQPLQSAEHCGAVRRLPTTTRDPTEHQH